MDSRYASRKFILAAFLLVAALALLVLGKIDQATWERFCTWVLGLYITGNVGTYAVAKVAEPRS
jgi:hypothetical protein